MDKGKRFKVSKVQRFKGSKGLILCVLCALCGLVFAETAMLHSFNKGEVTPRLGARSDVKMYYSGCRLLENFYCQVWGGASKRPGTYFISEVSDSEKQTRLIPFCHSTEVNYVLELGNETIQFYLGD